MSMQQVSVGELLLSLDSTDLQEAEQGREAISQQLNSDRGGAVLCSLVDCCLNSSSSCELILTLLSSIREPLHKALLDKLNEAVSRPVSRLAAVTLLGHMISQQPPWIHRVSRSPLLATLLRCLKSDSDVKLLVPGVLVIVMLLPMIPQAAKQHIYDFFDVFGRLASWSLKNPGHTPTVHVVHLHAGVYSLFHRLYGMFPCNFLSYLRLHYSMKENLDTFQHVVKPMLDQVRVHPELVSGTQDSELDPSRWRHYEVHDIIMECSRVSLDPLESCCDDHMPAHLDHTCPRGASRSKEGERTHTSCLSGSALDIDHLDVQVLRHWPFSYSKCQDTPSRAELSACEARCTALRKTVRTLQREMLHLGSAQHLTTCSDIITFSAPQARRRRARSPAVLVLRGGHCDRPSTSPVLLAAAVGSFLERRAWRLFRPPDRNPEDDEARTGSPREDAALLAGSAQMRRAPDPSLAVRQRRRELSIMDYDDTTARA
ncbi:TSC complex subunit 1a [Phyllopteryx taeniolatus]|uniref:TSC complex subunit 1a n=1 Tax=Phyllopteryx taeniolatus TaxID=161469 RepID=UPI002AD4BA7F|nr:TSC complex subunit 1a [Phyllopteryx taeniolatus]